MKDYKYLPIFNYANNGVILSDFKNSKTDSKKNMQIFN